MGPPHRDDDLITRTEADRRFVTVDRFTPVERLVYGVVSLAMTALLLGLLSLVVRR